MAAPGNELFHRHEQMLDRLLDGVVDQGRWPPYDFDSIPDDHPGWDRLLQAIAKVSRVHHLGHDCKMCRSVRFGIERRERELRRRGPVAEPVETEGPHGFATSDTRELEDRSHSQ